MTMPSPPSCELVAPFHLSQDMSDLPFVRVPPSRIAWATYQKVVCLSADFPLDV